MIETIYLSTDHTPAYVAAMSSMKRNKLADLTELKEERHGNSVIYTIEANRASDFFRLGGEIEFYKYHPVAMELELKEALGKNKEA